MIREGGSTQDEFDDDLEKLTELTGMDVESIHGVDVPANGFPILMIKSLPPRSAPGGRPAVAAAPASAASAPGSAQQVIRKAAKRAVKARAGELRREAEDLRKRVARVEKSGGPKCGSCGKRNRPGAAYCQECGRGVAGVGLVKSSGAAVDVAREVDLIRKARSSDPATRDAALGKLMERHGPDVAARVIDGSLTVRELAGSLVKAEADAREAEHQRPCKTCNGTGRLKHPSSGKPSRKCPACDGTGRLAAGEVPDATDAGGVAKLARLAAKALSGDQDALGQLIGQVGPVIAARVLSGESVSAEEFARGYVSAGRARLSAAPDQRPRVPQATHVIRPGDFTRGPLPPPQSRPAPGSQWPGGGGQADWYGGGAGVQPDAGSAPYPLPGLAASTRPGL